MLVRNNMPQFGDNAGKVWQVISNKGNVTIDDLRFNTQLSEKDLFTAVGWLARENKIKKVNDRYILDETNLDGAIGSTAGKVFKILDIWEQADLQTMKRLSDEPDEDIYTALGWLAREDKLKMDKDQKYSLKYD